MSLVLIKILSYKGLYSDSVDSSQIFYNEMVINTQFLQEGKQSGFPLPTSGARPWVFETEIYKEKNGEVFRHKSMFSEAESVCITSTSEHCEGEPIGGLETVPSRFLWSELWFNSNSCSA